MILIIIKCNSRIRLNYKIVDLLKGNYVFFYLKYINLRNYFPKHFMFIQIASHKISYSFEIKLFF